MYRPLPDGVTIKESEVQGLGLFATKDFEADTILGSVHIMNKNFHQLPVCYLMTTRSVKAGEELTAKYTLYKDFSDKWE